MWGTNAGGQLDSDCWAPLLIAGRYPPDPRVQGGAIGATNANSVLVCPAVSDAPVPDGTVTLAAPFDVQTSVGVKDGYRRRVPKVLLNEASTPTPELATNGANGACIPDVGYGGTYTETVNGATTSLCRHVPMQGVPVNAAGAAQTLHCPATKLSQFRRSEQAVLLFDGSGWDPFCTQTPHPWRIVGARHGRWLRGGNNPSTGTGYYNDFSTGICNVLFVDGHATAVSRGDLPCEPNGTSSTASVSTQILGDLTTLMDPVHSPRMTGNGIVWSLAQQHP